MSQNTEHKLEELVRDVVGGVSCSLSQFEKILQHREDRAQAGMFGSGSGSDAFKKSLDALSECELELAQVMGEPKQFRSFADEGEALFNPSITEAHAPAA